MLLGRIPLSQKGHVSRNPKQTPDFSNKGPRAPMPLPNAQCVYFTMGRAF